MMAQPEKRRRRRRGVEGGDRGENKSRAGAPGNVGVTHHIVTFTDVSFKAEITELHGGHLAVSRELLLSINAYCKHTHTLFPAHIQVLGGRERERRASYLQLMNYV